MTADSPEPNPPELNPGAPWIEAAGTALLTMTIFGSGIMATNLGAGDALVLLVVSAATGAMLCVLITLLGPVSGGHINPAITLTSAMAGAISWRRAAVFAAAQLAGALAGMILTHALFDQPLAQLGQVARSGPHLWLSEGLATFGLIALAVLGSHHRPAQVPALVGLYVFAGFWFWSSTGFENPAVTVARALTASGAGIRPVDAPAYILAQFAGAALAVVVLRRTLWR
ncbi:MAG TPA: aquaporin [Paracoccus sp. (in: a-proteobacteria)]|nr:aquaporin [Paracoccus sp. (in: a-proteobacteria)]